MGRIDKGINKGLGILQYSKILRTRLMWELLHVMMPLYRLWPIKCLWLVNRNVVVFRNWV